MPKDQSCSNCLFWDADLCKRYPPVLARVPNTSGNADQSTKDRCGFAFPVTLKTDWCGEWKTSK